MDRSGIGRAARFARIVSTPRSVILNVIQLWFMSHFSVQIERITGLPCPQSLLDLIDGNLLRDLCPLTIRFTDVEWIFPVFEVADPNDMANYDYENRRYRFAHNDDGFPLHIDLSTDRLEVLLEEFDDVDTLGIDVADLLDSISCGRYTKHDV